MWWWHCSSFSPSISTAWKSHWCVTVILWLSHWRQYGQGWPYHISHYKFPQVKRTTSHNLMWPCVLHKAYPVTCNKRSLAMGWERNEVKTWTTEPWAAGKISRFPLLSLSPWHRLLWILLSRSVAGHRACPGGKHLPGMSALCGCLLGERLDPLQHTRHGAGRRNDGNGE